MKWLVGILLNDRRCVKASVETLLRCISTFSGLMEHNAQRKGHEHQIARLRLNESFSCNDLKWWEDLSHPIAYKVMADLLQTLV